jgi:hypothetical protein
MATNGSAVRVIGEPNVETVCVAQRRAKSGWRQSPVRRRRVATGGKGPFRRRRGRRPRRVAEVRVVDDPLPGFVEVLDPALVAVIGQRGRVDLGRPAPREKEVLLPARHRSPDPRADYGTWHHWGSEKLS